MELIERAASGDLDGVKALIQQGVSVNTRNQYDQTALYVACGRGHSAVVRYLLESGASVNLGANSLTAAITKNDCECAKLLLEHHVNITFTNTEEESALRMCHYSMILLLLQYGAIPSSSLEDAAVRLLKHTEAEHAKAVQALIDQNIINLTSESVFLAALSFASKFGLVELTDRMLLNDSWSKTDQLYPDAVYYSSKNNWPAVLSKLLEKRVSLNALTGGETPLYAACKKGHEAIVTFLLNNGADPNVKNELYAAASKKFLLPLQVAVQQGNAAICTMLLQKGATLDLPREPLLHIACSTATNGWTTDESAETSTTDQKLSTVRLLLQQEVNVNAFSDKGDTALYRACTHQQLEVVQILLEAGADVNLTSSRRYPLIAACDAGNVELINLLVSAGADVKCSNSSDETCLHALITACPSARHSQEPAAGVSKADIVSAIKSLLELGADINKRASMGDTALYRASEAGHEDIVRLLLDAGAETSGSNSRRPLHAACEHSYTEIVDMLLESGAGPNASSTASYSYGVRPIDLSRLSLISKGMATSTTSSSSLPICIAARKGCAEIVQLLLMHGADVNKRDELGNTALIYVVESLVAQRCKRSEVLNPLSEETDFSILKSILLAGGDVTLSSRYDGLSPLHIASFGGMCDLMMELIQHGANCNQLTSSGLGLSALDLACENSHESAVVLLLENGANPDGKSGSTRSTRSDSYKSHSMPPLCMAAKNGSKTVVDILLKYGANVNASSEKGDTALHLATSYAIIETLLNAKANVSATNYNGETALSALCEKRQADANAVELLLKHGADPNTGFPLHAACENNDTDIVKLLLSYGANENLPKKSERSVSIGLLHFGLSGFIPTTSTVEPSPLCIACKNGNVAVVDCLFKKAADVAFADSGGNTALHFSIERLQERREQHEKSEEYDPIVTLLLQHNAPVNVVSSKGETPLYLACMKGLVGVTKQLLDCRADVGLTTSNSNKYPLLIACERKYRDVAIMLLDRGANANASKDNETPLKLASANGDAELVKQLIRYGADVHQIHGIGDTALHIAIDHARKYVENKAFVGIVQRLLKSGAGPNVLNDKRETPLYLASKPADNDVNLGIVQALLKHGADPNVAHVRRYYDDHGISPLSAASVCGNTTLVNLLMKYGAAVDQKNEHGRTALHYAIGCDYDSFTPRSKLMNSYTSTVEELLSAGADTNAMDASGDSPLYLACERGEHEIVKLLLSRGANPNNVKATKRPKYPIHAACRRQHYDLIKLLLEFNADVAVRDQHGKTALHGVLESTSRQSSWLYMVGQRQVHDDSSRGDASGVDMVQLLVDRGADVNAVSENGETPFYVACSKGLTSVVDKMLEYGAKLDGSSDRKLPLIVAC